MANEFWCDYCGSGNDEESAHTEDCKNPELKILALEKELRAARKVVGAAKYFVAVYDRDLLVQDTSFIALREALKSLEQK